jgi:hypothetical protein
VAQDGNPDLSGKLRVFAGKSGERGAQGSDRLTALRRPDDVGRGEFFERGTNLVETTDLIGCEPVDAQTSTGTGLDQAFLLKVAQGLAYCPAADYEVLREIHLADVIPRDGTDRW